ncbi:hypothetical protein GS597_07550 [Synechococcales cyanobacterium C]|uniref:Uncharacterized protein n=1 Tax=Petrachloros mirabilis ULC683 TaxID=2781853 RepID=A0A8K2A6Z9_9CYAN|nr:hypothetical protein [Petrachloros mirabilis]NCJ06366.1 hypothetical protein [Petrachloros mirabilis ULC683]
MATYDSDLTQLLSPELYQRLLAHQQQQGYATLAETLAAALSAYFGQLSQDQPASQDLKIQIHALEQRLQTLTQEVVRLRQDVPHRYDQLREQMATVRLSHSGLLRDLRQRLEALEQSLAQPADGYSSTAHESPITAVWPQTGEVGIE